MRAGAEPDPGLQGGQYGFQRWENGALVRSIIDDTHQGEPLAEEDGVDLASVDDSTVIALWKRHGLADPLEGKAPFRVFRRRVQEAPPPPKKPWWKLW